MLFLFRNVFHLELGDMGGTVRARRGAKLPVVLSVEETRSILGKLQGVTRLMLELVYGGGLRVSEVVILRVKDIDFDADTLDVRSGTGSAQSAGRAVTSNIKGVDRSLARARRSPAA